MSQKGQGIVKRTKDSMGGTRDIIGRIVRVTKGSRAMTIIVMMDATEIRHTATTQDAGPLARFQGSAIEIGSAIPMTKVHVVGTHATTTAEIESDTLTDMARGKDGQRSYGGGAGALKQDDAATAPNGGYAKEAPLAPRRHQVRQARQPRKARSPAHAPAHALVTVTVTGKDPIIVHVLVAGLDPTPVPVKGPALVRESR